MIPMKNKFLNILILCCLSLIGYGQTNTVEFQGTITETNDSIELINNVQIFVLKGSDTLGKVFSETNGSYKIKLELSPNEQITLTTKHKYYLSQKVDFTMVSNSNSIQLDFKLLPLFIDKLNSAIFENDNFSTFTGFDIELMKFQLRKLDNFCIQFNHITFTNESDALAKKRLNTFKQFLIENDMNLDKFIFNEVNFKYECSEIDCRGRIDGILLSMDEKCK
jgi:hypothetical protein